MSWMLLRARNFLVLGFTYRAQSKARVLHLYHKILQVILYCIFKFRAYSCTLMQYRADGDRLARARLRYQYTRHKLDEISA